MRNVFYGSNGLMLYYNVEGQSSVNDSNPHVRTEWDTKTQYFDYKRPQRPKPTFSSFQFKLTRQCRIFLDLPTVFTRLNLSRFTWLALV
jgi:hypothetical protein